MEALPETQREEAAATLKTLIDAGLIGAKDMEFASSLSAQFAKKGKLSDKQWYWVGVMVERGLSGETKPHKSKAKTFNVGDVHAIFEFFATAKKKLKKPGLIFTLKNGRTYKLYLRGADISIVDKNIYPGGWRLVLDKNGRIEFWSKINDEEANLLVNLIRYLAKDVHGTVKAHGTKSNHCCMCSKELTVPKSVNNGYGPTCAKNWGLKY